MRTVKDMLNSKPVTFNSIEPDALVIDALQMLNSVNLSYLVVKKADEFKGFFAKEITAAM